MRRIPTGTPSAGPTTSRSSIRPSRPRASPRSTGVTRSNPKRERNYHWMPAGACTRQPTEPPLRTDEAPAFLHWSGPVFLLPKRVQPHLLFQPVRVQCIYTDQVPVFRLPKREQAHTNTCSQDARSKSTAKRGYPSRSTNGNLVQIKPSIHSSPTTTMSG
jgi:hypothetical protein